MVRFWIFDFGFSIEEIEQVHGTDFSFYRRKQREQRKGLKPQRPKAKHQAPSTSTKHHLPYEADQ